MKPVNSDEQHFEAMNAASRIRKIQLPQLFPGIEKQRVEIGAIDPDTKHPNHVDMLYVCAIAGHSDASSIFEFGTYLGRTTYHMARAASRAQIYTLDIDPAVAREGLKLGGAVRAVLDRGLQGCFFRETPEASRIKQLHGDSRTFDYGSLFGAVDFIFIDAGHTYEFVANDTRHALKMLRPGGVIVWHDYAPKSRDVVTFARDFSSERSLFWIEGTSLLVHVDGVDAMQHSIVLPSFARKNLKPE